MFQGQIRNEGGMSWIVQVKKPSTKTTFKLVVFKTTFDRPTELGISFVLTLCLVWIPHKEYIDTNLSCQSDEQRQPFWHQSRLYVNWRDLVYSGYKLSATEDRMKFCALKTLPINSLWYLVHEKRDRHSKSTKKVGNTMFPLSASSDLNQWLVTSAGSLGVCQRRSDQRSAAPI